MQKTFTHRRQVGFTLIELLVSMVIGALLVGSLFQLWNNNLRSTDRIQKRGDFRDAATLATTQLNHSIMMAGFGMSKMEVMVKATSDSTDTLTLYSNTSEIRTTLRDTAREFAHEIVVFKDTGFVIGSYIGITDSLHQEYNRITGISGDSATGYRISLENNLQHAYYSGVPDIYPVQREIIYIEGEDHDLIRKVNDRKLTLAKGITDFRVSLLDGAGNPTSTYRSIRVVTFNLTGSYKAPAGTPNQMRFSSTVIPRNIL